MARIAAAFVLAPLSAILLLCLTSAAGRGAQGGDAPSGQVPTLETVRLMPGSGVPVHVPQDGRCIAGRFAPAPDGHDARQPYVYPVRPAPHRSRAPHDTVRAGDRAHSCDPRRVAIDPAALAADTAEAPGLDWVGVVYGRSDDGCGLGREGLRRRAYAGPCRSGWVEQDQFAADPAGRDDLFAVADPAPDPGER